MQLLLILSVGSHFPAIICMHTFQILLLNLVHIHSSDVNGLQYFFVRHVYQFTTLAPASMTDIETTLLIFPTIHSLDLSKHSLYIYAERSFPSIKI